MIGVDVEDTEYRIMEGGDSLKEEAKDKEKSFRNAFTIPNNTNKVQ